MKKILNLLICGVLLALVSSLTSCASTGLKSSNTKGFGPFTARIPYANMAHYFGYVSESIQPDGKYKDKDAYYLYFWVPAVIDEVGVSMYSPADKAPKEGDFKHFSYAKMIKKDPKAFFDTYLVLEKLAIYKPEQIKNGGKVLSTLNTNDDTSELPANPSGSKYNSILRHVSDTGDPLKALVRGVYRISFTSFRGSVQGSYIASVGTNIPGVVIAASLEKLHNLVNNKK